MAKRGARFTTRDLERWPDLKAKVEEALADIAADDARSRAAIKKSAQQAALVRAAENPTSMVDIPGPLLVRIIRHVRKGGKVYDDDNFTGGCKELRDAIASACGLKGDSQEDGIAFEYSQIKTESPVSETVIEIYRS